MGKCILHHEGKFLIYSSVSDAPVAGVFDEDGLRSWIGAEYGRVGLEEFPPRLDRAKRLGTSSMQAGSLGDTIFLNRAGLNETTLSEEQFVQAYFVDGDDVPLPRGRSLEEEVNG